MESPVNAIYRICAVRYGADGYLAAVRWCRMELDTDNATAGQLEEVGADRAMAAAYANLVYAWGPSRLVNRIVVEPKAFGGSRLADSSDAAADSWLTSMPRF
ncbi:hypothetical protein GT347_20060 [Xylophilus rhododendri]|uniref:Uncharacterized protein n=1 Tax=Xylophilus rhododendri TaxID=2697032 RepID=A0A857JAK1_9BURK|nr:hypothetical protein [Xylophilus rhododendri]QHJ00070.1 hypothetical protein GT347_20060 [Xylophilus rhododendri]